MRFALTLGWLTLWVGIRMGGQEVCTIEKLDEIIARFRVVKLLDKIMPSDYNDLVEAVKCLRDLVAVLIVPPIVPLERIASNVITADGTEQTLIEVTGLARYYGTIGLEEMEDGDAVVIKIYLKTIETADWKRYWTQAYAGKQEDPLVELFRVVCEGFRVTLQQVKGVYRSFEYAFYKG